MVVNCDTEGYPSTKDKKKNVQNNIQMLIITELI